MQQGQHEDVGFPWSGQEDGWRLEGKKGEASLLPSRSVLSATAVTSISRWKQMEATESGCISTAAEGEAESMLSLY